jgi:endonuclease V-like protein UPF0215 family
MIPIYLANVEVLVMTKSINKNVQNIEKKIILLKSIVVKGFSIYDIKKRDKAMIIKKASQLSKLEKNQEFQIRSFNLISQHGYGVP